MPAITPKQKTILNALVTQLQLINGTGNYNQTVQKVTRYHKPLADVNAESLPYISVIPVGTAFSFKMNDFKTAGNALLDPADGWRVMLVCYSREIYDAAESSLLQDELIELYTDIEYCISTDPTIAGNVLQTRLIYEQMGFDYEKGSGILQIELSLKYDFDPGVDP